MITLPELEFEIDDLNPLISEKTISFHYGKHHQGYVNKLNALIPDLDPKFDNYSVEDILMNIDRVDVSKRTAVFNNAGQIFNHNLYWKSLKKKASEPSQNSNQLIDKISETFGTLEKFLEIWKKEGSYIFGSGWLWLVSDGNGRLSIEKTFNAHTPLVKGKNCLLVMDVWEHAYYLDYQNNRGAYIDAYIDLINWDAANERFLS